MKVQYPTIICQRTLAGKLFVLETIRDLDEAIDLLCDSMSDGQKSDPFAEDLCPYFGILWPAAEGLAIYLADHAQLIKKRKILELGCGLGLPSIVASHLGAEVLATDFHPQVQEYFLRNCRHSVVDCHYQRLNWRQDKTDVGQYDIVMGSDVLYESKHPREVALGLIRFLKPQGKILLSDPGRAYLQTFIHAMNQEGYKEELIPVKVVSKDIFVFLFEKATE